MHFPRMAVAAVALMAVAGSASTQSRNTGPIATYWMTAKTTSGMPAMGPGTSPLAMMSAMTASGAAQQSLLLQLGSTQAADRRAEADHLPPAGLGVGPTLSLTVKTEAHSGDTPIDQTPTGTPRVLIYFGCGHETKARQPLSVRLDQEGARQLSAIMAGHRVTPSNPPSPSNSRTYAEWPTSAVRVRAPTGSLVGEHMVKGAYTPDIRFSLDATQDFLAPLVLTGLGQPGPVRLGWNSIPNAKGYFVTTIGQNEAGEMVVWTSSETAAFPMHIPELLSPADLTRLQGARTVLPATATSCAIPTAVTTAAPDSMLRVIAYGGEANFAWPPRPTQSGAVWNIESMVKVRYNSTIGAMLGMEADEDEAAEDAAPASPMDILPGGQAARALGSALNRFRNR